LSEDCRGPVDEGRNGYLVPIKDSGALARAIAGVINDDKLLRRLGRHSREKAVSEFEERRIVPQALAQCGWPVV
jgi:N,N'-diacetylbacillosaminyl-diphospho-undecaprenol alpha-1,3-N-acetylgalactosaminyltransferase